MSGGSVKPLDHLRWIKTNAVNVRDLGGWTCDGGTVKYGMLFRGGQLTSSDRTVLVEELDVHHDLDLRGGDVEDTSSPLGSDVLYKRADSYCWYSLTPTKTWKEYIRFIFDAVNYGQPLYFHCAAGADRTGTVACILEGMLGMSQSDIDKDYELTCFYSSTSSDSTARRRNESEWKGLITAINARSGSSFRDKCIDFVCSLGFTIDEVRDFRAAMIDGTPTTVPSTSTTYSITKSLSSVSLDNSATSASQYTSFSANVTPSSGNVIQSVSIKMGGVDVTHLYWSGKQTLLWRNITTNLTGVVIDNTAASVINGQSFAARLTAEANYALDENSTINITMGGVDVSTYYSGGVIAIPSVTGDVVITVSATGAAEAPATSSNVLTEDWSYEGQSFGAIGYNENKRLSTSNGALKDATGCITTGFIPIAAMKELNTSIVIRISPLTSIPSSTSGEYACCAYSSASESAFVASSYLTSSNSWFDYTQEDETTVKLVPKSSAYSNNYIRICFPGNISTVYMTINAPIGGGGLNKTNLFDPSAAALNKRIDSNVATTEGLGEFVSDWIPCRKGDILFVKAPWFTGNSTATYYTTTTKDRWKLEEDPTDQQINYINIGDYHVFIVGEYKYNGIVRNELSYANEITKFKYSGKINTTSTAITIDDVQDIAIYKFE